MGGESPPPVHTPARARRRDAASDTRRRCARLATLHLREVRSVSQQSGVDSEREIASFGMKRGPESAGHRPAHRCSCMNRLFRRARLQKAYRHQAGRDRGPDRSSGEHRRKRTATARSRTRWPRDAQRAPAGLPNRRQVSPDRGGGSAFHACSPADDLDRELFLDARRAAGRVTGDGAPEVGSCHAVRRKCRPKDARAPSRRTGRRENEPFPVSGRKADRGKDRGAEAACEVCLVGRGRSNVSVVCRTQVRRA